MSFSYFTFSANLVPPPETFHNIAPKAAPNRRHQPEPTPARINASQNQHQPKPQPRRV